MLWQLYLRRNTTYVPTVARTEAGYYIDIEPVRVVSAKDSNALQRAIEQAMTEGNPNIPAPTRAAFPKPVVLKYAKVKSWSAFEGDALYWQILETDGTYQVKPGRRRPDGGWLGDAQRAESFPPGTAPDEVARRVAALVSSAAMAS